MVTLRGIRDVELELMNGTVITLDDIGDEGLMIHVLRSPKDRTTIEAEVECGGFDPQNGHKDLPKTQVRATTVLIRPSRRDSK